MIQFASKQTTVYNAREYAFCREKKYCTNCFYGHWRTQRGGVRGFKPPSHLQILL